MPQDKDGFARIPTELDFPYARAAKLAKKATTAYGLALAIAKEINGMLSAYDFTGGRFVLVRTDDDFRLVENAFAAEFVLTADLTGGDDATWRAVLHEHSMPTVFTDDEQVIPLVRVSDVGPQMDEVAEFTQVRFVRPVRATKRKKTRR